MGSSFKAGFRFTSCRTSALDPVYYKALDVPEDSWKRIERTMKGEKRGPNGTYLAEWKTATDRQKTLARSLDRLLDRRPFLDVGLFDEIYLRLRTRNATETEPRGILIQVVTPESWQRDGVPSRKCSIDWLDASKVTDQEPIEQQVALMLENLSYVRGILEIRTFLIDTTTGGTTELGYEIPIPADRRMEPQLA